MVCLVMPRPPAHPDAEAQLCAVCPAAGSCESHPVGAEARVIVCRDSFCSPSPEEMTRP